MKAFANFQIHRILLHICVTLQNCGRGLFSLGQKEPQILRKKLRENHVFAGNAAGWTGRKLVESSLEEQSISRSLGGHLKGSGRQGGL